jgi:hypothetical protein
MARRIRTLVASLAILGLVAGPAAAATTVEGHEAEAPPVMWDVFFIRPMSVLTTAVSIGVVFPIAALFTGITRPSEMGKPVETLVVKPLHFTFKRPLGEW